MERRRQNVLGDLQPLGPKKNRRAANSGFGEDLGSTDYTERPKIARNPQAKSSEKEREGTSSRVESPIDPDESGDPIDLISSRDDIVTSSNPKSYTGSTTLSKLIPQPAPFKRVSPTLPAGKSHSAPGATAKPRNNRPQTGKTKIIVDSDDDSMSRPSSRSAAASKGLNQSSPPPEQESEDTKHRTRRPQPAPFKKRTQSKETIAAKAVTSAPKLPAPPPWKTGGTLQAGSKLGMGGLLDHGETPASQRVGESQIDREALRNVRIPKKNDKNLRTITPGPVNDSRTEFKKSAAFPMAGYAKEVAAKQVDEATASRSPRKRFKPDDVERILKRAEEDDLMGTDDETLRKSAY